jgi:putative hemolysin
MEEVIIVSLCLALNAVFAAYEMAFVSVHKPELRALARKGHKDAQALLRLRDNPERTLSVLQIGITLVGAVAAAVGGAGATDALEPYFASRFGMNEFIAETLAVVIIVLPITYLSVVVGELVPKTLALRSPMRIVLAGAKWIFIADRVLSPLVRILEKSTHWILKSFFKDSKSQTSNAPQGTLEIDSFSPVHQSFILNMADIENKKIRDIFVPWSQAFSVRNTDPIEEVLQVVLNSGHTRLPVVQDSHVIGVLHTKEFMALKESGERSWSSIIRPILSVRSLDSALGVMRMMQERRSHMALVVSTENQCEGIVTLEDILEEVVGEIRDEDDDGKIRKVFAARAKARPKSSL